MIREFVNLFVFPVTLRAKCAKLSRHILLLLFFLLTNTICAKAQSAVNTSSDEAGKVEASLNWSAETTSRVGSALAAFENMTKADEIRLGLKLGVDFGLTWTCYRGGDKPCGKCDSCLLRAKAFAEVGIPDPALTR